MFGTISALGRASTVAFAAVSRAGHHHHRLLSNPMASYSYYSTSTALQATQYLLRYDYIPDVLEKRGPFREGHLDLAKQMIAEGTCLSGGPLGEVGMEVPSGALFIFTEEAAVKAFVEGDPYVSNGIVTGHTIEEWNVVVEKE